MGDGSVRLMDSDLRRAVSPLLSYPTNRRVQSLSLLPNKDAFTLKTLLTCQPWRNGESPLLPNKADSLLSLSSLFSEIGEESVHVDIDVDMAEGEEGKAQHGANNEVRLWIKI